MAQFYLNLQKEKVLGMEILNGITKSILSQTKHNTKHVALPLAKPSEHCTTSVVLSYWYSTDYTKTDLNTLS